MRKQLMKHIYRVKKHRSLKKNYAENKKSLRDSLAYEITTWQIRKVFPALGWQGKLEK